MSHHFLLELLRRQDRLRRPQDAHHLEKAVPGVRLLVPQPGEFIAAFKNGDAPYINNLGIHGRTRSPVWKYDGLAGFGQERDELLAAHPCPKPLPLIANAILD